MTTASEGRSPKWPYAVPWQVPVTGIVTFVGIGISIYLTWVHYGTPGGGGVSCPITSGTFNCEHVITSPQSVIFGIPVAVYGLIWMVGMFTICLPWAWRSSAALGPLGAAWGRRIGYARLAGVVVGIGFVLYLISVELFEIHEICIWCTSVHFLTFVLLVTVVSSTPWSLGQGFEDAA